VGAPVAGGDDLESAKARDAVRLRFRVMRTRTTITLAVVAAVAFAGCGDDDPAPRAKPPKTFSPAPTLDAITTPPPAEPSGATSPDDAALTLHEHWVAGDSAAALETATQQAVNELFAHPGNPLDFQGCIREGSEHTCFFYYEGGGLNMIVSGDPADGYLVTKAFFVAD
jgi:hypothetical protein